MTPALDVDECVSCVLVNACDHWNVKGTWPHSKGLNPCRPPAIFDCPPHSAKADCVGCRRTELCKTDMRRSVSTQKHRIIITEEPIISETKPISKIIDAEQVQRDRFSLRRER